MVANKVNFHVFEIHTLNADLCCWKVYLFLPKLHEIAILNAVCADRDDAWKKYPFPPPGHNHDSNNVYYAEIFCNVFSFEDFADHDASAKLIPSKNVCPNYAHPAIFNMK